MYLSIHTLRSMCSQLYEVGNKQRPLLFNVFCITSIILTHFPSQSPMATIELRLTVCQCHILSPFDVV